MNDAVPVKPPVVDSTFDITRPLFAEGPPDPIVYDGSERAMRQRTVNFAAKRFADMLYVSGLDRSTAERHFRWRALAHDSPHSQMAPNICAKRGWAASIWANRSMSGSRRKSVMFGMSS